jgi:hypothetical protein
MFGLEVSLLGATAIDVAARVGAPEADLVGRIRGWQRREYLFFPQQQQAKTHEQQNNLPPPTTKRASCL